MRGTILLRGNYGANMLVVPAEATFPLLDGGSITTTTVNDRIVNNGTVVKSGPREDAPKPADKEQPADGSARQTTRRTR